MRNEAPKRPFFPLDVLTSRNSAGGRKRRTRSFEMQMLNAHAMPCLLLRRAEPFNHPNDSPLRASPPALSTFPDCLPPGHKACAESSSDHQRAGSTPWPRTASRAAESQSQQKHERAVPSAGETRSCCNASQHFPSCRIHIAPGGPFVSAILLPFPLLHSHAAPLYLHNSNSTAFGRRDTRLLLRSKRPSLLQSVPRTSHGRAKPSLDRSHSCITLPASRT